MRSAMKQAMTVLMAAAAEQHAHRQPANETAVKAVVGNLVSMHDLGARGEHSNRASIFCNGANSGSQQHVLCTAT